jgi:tetratricopeptide (TPR) repeat protein
MHEVFSYFTGTPSEPGTMNLRSSWAAKHGRVGEVRSLSRRGEELAQDFLGDSGVARAKIIRAANLAELGYEDEAVEVTNEALALGRDVFVLTLASNVVAATGDADEAQALIDELDQRWPQNTVVQGSVIPRQRAQLALRAGDPVEAVDLLETARPFERNDVATVKLRGRALLAQGAAAAAVAEFEKMISLQHTFPFATSNSTAYLWLGRAHRDNGDPAAARAAYEQFFEIMKDADEGVPVIEKARAEYATIPGAQG